MVQAEAPVSDAFVVDRGIRSEPHRYAVVDRASGAVLALERDPSDADKLARWLSGERPEGVGDAVKSST